MTPLTPRKFHSGTRVKGFYSDPFTSRRILAERALPILKLIVQGNYPSKAARILGLSKQHIHYYCRRFVELGYLRRQEGSPVFYSITGTGQRFLTRCEGGLGGGGRLFRLHNVCLKFPVLVGPGVPVDWRKVAMQNWERWVGSELGLKVELTTGHVLVYADVVEGRNPFELLLYAFQECDRLADYLESKFRMKLGRPALARDPHWAIMDPVAGEVTRYLAVSGPSGKMDRSEGLGEIDWLDPKSALDYLMMPATLSNLERELLDLKSGMTSTFQTWNLIGCRLLELLELLKQVLSSSRAESSFVNGLRE